MARRVLVSGLLLAFAAGACAGARPPASDTARTSVYVCDHFDFTAKTSAAEAHLWLPPAFERPYRRLPRVPAASGARYDFADVQLWTKGDQALLQVDGGTPVACRRDPRRSIWEDAKLRGVDFRAVGNEPGWHLEITRGERMRLVADYGARQVSVPTPEPGSVPEPPRTVYRGANGGTSLRVELEARPCTDTMSGEHFETTVVVVLDGETLRGCGRPLH